MGIHNNAVVGASGQQDYQISRSVRIRQSASAYLNRTPASATNRKTWTWSGWVKIGKAASTGLFTASTSSSNMYTIQLGVGGELNVYAYTGSYPYFRYTSAVFRDYSAWYHFVVAFDSTQATDTDRIKIYVNGVLQSTVSGSGSGWPTLNYDGGVNNTINHQFSDNVGGASYFDGYLTEVNFIDGQALTPSSFGETNAVTGVWQPKKYAGTYGTNGFYLNFSDNSTAAALGTDFSGNSNTWTVNNISVTADATYDSMLDVPTPYADGGNGRGNYAVMNPNDQAGGLVLADGNLKVTAATGWDGARATFSYPSTGKWYWEALCIARSTGANVGILSTAAVITGDLGAAATGYAYNSGDGNKYNNGVNVAYGATWGANDILGIAWDADTGTLSFYKNGISQGTAYTGLTGAFSPMLGVNGSDSMAANFGQRPFSYTPPTGFVALNTQNLPTPTISNGASYMAATLYTGDGTANRVISGLSFTPDFIWIKNRSSTWDHVLGNYVATSGIGTPITLASNSTAAEVDGGYIGAQTTNSLKLAVSAGENRTNGNTLTYVAWQWNAGGSTVTNTDGTISSQVRANPTAGFSVVTYTGTGATATVGHGLGVAPSMILFKNRASTNAWCVYHLSISPANFLQFDTSAQLSATTYPMFGTTPTAATSTVFSIGTNPQTNAASTFVAYCFSEVSGYSKFGSYTGNSSADGPFVFTGFRPRFVMWKSSSNAGTEWVMYDTSRSTYNVMGEYLLANQSSAGASNSGVDFLSNGFKLKLAGGGSTNASGYTYIYMAFAENPFKNSLAR
jgi:hypothetical protein